MILEEKTLIKRCLDRDPMAQKHLYDLYSKKLYGICLRYSQSDEEAQDILQDSFIKIFSKLNTFQNTGSFEGWMKRIASNTAIEYYRKRIDIVEADEFTVSPYLSTQADNNLEVEELLKLIQNLPDGYRIVFNMYAIEGYNHGEIATKLGISEGTSKSQYSRAKVYLQKKIEEKYQLPRKSVQPLEHFLRLLN
jgi:RNA polymerase sigma factor (sigma-70 family)